MAFILGLFIGWVSAFIFWFMNWENLVSVDDVKEFYEWLVEHNYFN